MRNVELTKTRDRKMVEMFHNLYDVKRIRLDDVLRQLSERVFSCLQTTSISAYSTT